jgi:hypothetical protein
MGSGSGFHKARVKAANLCPPLKPQESLKKTGIFSVIVWLLLIMDSQHAFSFPRS